MIYLFNMSLLCPCIAVPPASLNLSKSPINLRYTRTQVRELAPQWARRLAGRLAESIRVDPSRSESTLASFATHASPLSKTYARTHARARARAHTHTHSYVYRYINTETNADYLRLVEVYTAPALHLTGFTPHGLYTAWVCTASGLRQNGFTWLAVRRSLGCVAGCAAGCAAGLAVYRSPEKGPGKGPSR